MVDGKLDGPLFTTSPLYTCKVNMCSQNRINSFQVFPTSCQSFAMTFLQSGVLSVWERLKTLRSHQTTTPPLILKCSCGGKPNTKSQLWIFPLCCLSLAFRASRTLKSAFLDWMLYNFSKDSHYLNIWFLSNSEIWLKLRGLRALLMTT